MNLRVATDGLEAAEAGGVGWWVGTAIGGQLAPPEYHGWCLVVVVVLGVRGREVPTGNLHLGKSAPPAYLLHWSNWHLWDLWH